MGKRGRLLDYNKVKDIKKLKDQGFTIREIVKMVGSSSASVVKYLNTEPNKDEAYTDAIQALKTQMQEINSKMDLLSKELAKLILQKNSNFLSMVRSADLEQSVGQTETNLGETRKTIDEVTTLVYRIKDGKNPCRDVIKEAVRHWKQTTGIEVKGNRDGLLLDVILEALKLYNQTARSYKLDLSELEKIVTK